MKVSITDPKPSCYLVALLLAMVALPAARCQDATRRRQVIPLIQMDSVPLRDGIRNLARQTGQNFILDPRLGGRWVGADGRAGSEPSVSISWTNLTADEALGQLLKDYGLVMVTNPATSIGRIAFTNQLVKPVPASAVGARTNPVIPLIVMDSVPLADAIRNLAHAAQLRLAEDPSSALASLGRASRPPSELDISVRWENVTARQALAALLDNYDLALVEDSTGSSARIIARPQAQPSEPPKER